MFNRAPPIARLSHRVLADVENAVRRFPGTSFPAFPAGNLCIIAFYAKSYKSRWSQIRTAERIGAGSFKRQGQALAMQMRLRESGNRNHASLAGRRYQQLRLPAPRDGGGITSQSRIDRNANVEAMARHGQPLHSAMPEKLASIRRSRHPYLRALAGFRELLGRYGRVSKREAHIGSIPEQRWELRAIQLPLGDVAAATSQSFGHTVADIQGRDALRRRMVPALGNQFENNLWTAEQRAVGRRSSRYSRKTAEAAQALGSRSLKPLSAGCDFLGYVIYPSHRVVRRRVVGHLHQKLKAWPMRSDSRPAAAAKLRSVIASYAGHFSHASSGKARRRIGRAFPWLKQFLQKGKP